LSLELEHAADARTNAETTKQSAARMGTSEQRPVFRTNVRHHMLVRVFKRMLERMRARWLRPRLGRMESVFAAHADFLDHVYARSFTGTDKTRFMLLWCEMAEICRL
jgi:hypothetical protein